MTAHFNNPWVELWHEQMWFCRQITDVAAKTIDLDLPPDPQALSDRCLCPMEPRLNPFEFHGKRRSTPPRVATSNGFEREMPRPRTRRESS